MTSERVMMTLEGVMMTPDPCACHLNGSTRHLILSCRLVSLITASVDDGSQFLTLDLCVNIAASFWHSGFSSFERERASLFLSRCPLTL